MTPEEFDRFYAGCASRLVRQRYALLDNLAEAQDVAQEAFVRAWDRRRHWTGWTTPRPGCAPSPGGWGSVGCAGCGRRGPGATASAGCSSSSVGPW